MIIRNKIWEEIVHADANAICSRRYATVQRRIQIAYAILIPFCSALCALFAKLEWKEATIGTAVMMFISTLAKGIFPKIILSERNIIRLDELFKEFMDYRNNIEKLFDDFDNNVINQRQAKTQLDDIIQSNTKRTAELNKLVLWIPKCIDNSITKESEEYLNRVYKNIYE